MTEYAKTLVYEDRKNILKQDQLYIFYDTLGRYQSLDEAKQIDIAIKELLDTNNIKYIEYDPYKETIKSFIERNLIC